MLIARLAVAGLLAAASAAGEAHAQAWLEESRLCRRTDLTPDQRIEHCDAAAGLLPDLLKTMRARVIVDRSDAKLVAGRYDGAIADAELAAGLAPDEISSHNARCWTRAVANRELDVARAACDRALAIDDEDAAVWDSRGLVGLREGEWQRAWDDYNRAFTLRAAMIGSLYGRGLAALALGRTINGETDIASAMAANPSVAAEFANFGLAPDVMRGKPPKG